MRFLPDDETMKYVMSLTINPSDANISRTVNDIMKLLPNDGSVDAEIELITMAVDPVHPGIKERLHKALSEVKD